MTSEEQSRKLAAERQRRMRTRRQTYETALRAIRDDRDKIRTLDDAIAAAAVALATLGSGRLQRLPNGADRQP